MKNIQERVESTYINNINYLQKNHEKIFSKIASLDSAIEQGLYQDKYDLVYEKNHFDVKELGTQNYLYNSDPDIYAQEVASSINYNKQTNLFKTYKDIHINAKDLDKYESTKITENNLSGLASIIHYINQSSPSKYNMKDINKFIFFGTGLGEHLTVVDKKINAKVYLIIEDDLELFKLSLFVTPYNELAKNSTLIFSILESSAEFSNTAKLFLNTNFEYNHYLKYFQMLNHNEDKLQDFHIAITSQSHNLFFYNSILEQYLKPLEYINEHYKFLNILKKYSKLTLGQKPVLLLAAGPSLQKNIAWVKENQDKFVIIALSATLIELEKYNIVPDIITHLDGFDISANHFLKLVSLKLFKDTLFLLSARTPNKIIEMLDKKNIFFFENGTNYRESLGNLSAPCVGSTTYLLLLAFDVKELYLLGLDLALDRETGMSHSNTHFESQQIDLDNADIHEDNMSLRSSVIKYPSNFSKDAYTNPNFLISIESINSTSEHFKKEYQNVYNLSDGVLFNNTTPKYIEQIEIHNFEEINKTEIKRKLLKEFDNNAFAEILIDEKEKIMLRYQYALRVKKIIKKQQSIKFSSDKQFLKSIEVLLSNLTKDSSTKAYDISLVYQEYFHILNTFIFDYFNVAELKDTNLHANNINTLLCKQLNKIQGIYEEGLKKFI